MNLFACLCVQFEVQNDEIWIASEEF
jgi:hypothetical protein